MIRAAGLALTARSLTPAALAQSSALHDLCTWVDEDVTQDKLAETLVARLVGRQTTPSAAPPSAAGSLPDTVQRFDLLYLDTLCNVLRDKAVLLGDKAVLSLERVALLRACARDWLEAPRSGICREVPIAYVAENGQGSVHDTLAIPLAQEALTQLRTRRDPLAKVPVPIHVDLDTLASQELDTVAEALLASLQAQAPPERVMLWIRRQLPTAYCWLILDALDQVQARDLEGAAKRGTRKALWAFIDKKAWLPTWSQAGLDPR